MRTVLDALGFAVSVVLLVLFFGPGSDWLIDKDPLHNGKTLSLLVATLLSLGMAHFGWELFVERRHRG